jgi:hypothetical protein
VSVDSLFHSIFVIGKPVELSVDAETRQMVVRPISIDNAREQGCIRRERNKKESMPDS